MVTWINQLPHNCCVWCVYVCLYICAHGIIVCCFAWGSSVKTWHPPEDVTDMSQINFSVLFQLKIQILKAYIYTQEAYIMQRGLKWILFIVQSRRQCAYSPPESLFRLYLVMQREINAVWAGGMINCSQSSPSMVQPLNNGVTTDPGSRYNIRDGAYSRDGER